MKEVFEIIFDIIWRVLKFWMAMEINGFRPFWYLVALSLLGWLGAVFNGSAGGISSMFGGWASGSKTVKNKIIIKNK